MKPDEPKIIALKSKSLNLEAGTYYYCRCGRSKDGLFCDGSHKETIFEPKKFVIEEPQSVYICMCKHTKNAPFCDGTHRQLKKEEENENPFYKNI